MKWPWGRGDREPGWLAVSIQPGTLSYAHGQHRANGKSVIGRCGTHALEAQFRGADRLARELHLDRYRCSTLLAPGEYQLLLVEAPKVPQAELKTAVRWRVKDLLDYHLDDATIDVLDIPPADPADTSRARSMYAVAARNAAIQGCIERFDAARIPLSVIEIAETAQRNLAALFEQRDRGLALLYLGPGHGLLTVSFRAELYLARRIEVGMDQLLAGKDARHQGALDRVALELQRTFDHFDRQYPFVAVAQLLLAPEPGDSGLAEHLARNIDIPIGRMQLGEALSFGADAALDPAAEWRLFHLLGAALRHEAKAL